MELGSSYLVAAGARLGHRALPLFLRKTQLLSMKQLLHNNSTHSTHSGNYLQY